MKEVTVVMGYPSRSEVHPSFRKNDLWYAIKNAQDSGPDDPCLTIDTINSNGTVRRIWSCFLGVH